MLWTERKSHGWHRGKKGKVLSSCPLPCRGREQGRQVERGNSPTGHPCSNQSMCRDRADNTVNWKGSLKAVEQKLLGCPIIGSVQSQAGQYFEQADQGKERCPCSWQGGCTKCSLKVPSNPNSSVFP